MKPTLKAIAILEQYSKLLLNQTDLSYEELQEAINQLKDVEHYAVYTSGQWATDRPDLFSNQIKNGLMHQLDFWEKHDNTYPKPKCFAPYVDETLDPAESFIVFCENRSPWDEDENNMIRVHSNTESHKLLNILEKHFGIPNNFKE